MSKFGHKSQIIPSVLRLRPYLERLLPDILHFLGDQNFCLGGICQRLGGVCHKLGAIKTHLGATETHLGGECHFWVEFRRFCRGLTYLSQKNENILGIVCYICDQTTKMGGALGGLCETGVIFG
jgi:hypothetical protein